MKREWMRWSLRILSHTRASPKKHHSHWWLNPINYIFQMQAFKHYLTTNENYTYDSLFCVALRDRQFYCWYSNQVVPDPILSDEDNEDDSKNLTRHYLIRENFLSLHHYWWDCFLMQECYYQNFVCFALSQPSKIVKEKSAQLFIPRKREFVKCFQKNE